VRTEIVEASGQLGIGPLQVQLQGQYRIEHLADGTVRLTEILDQRAGAGADAGARIELDTGAHEYRSGAMAGAAALAGVRTGRTWVIPADQVDEVIVSSNLDRVDPGGGLRRAVSEGNELVDRALPDGIGPVDLPFDEASSAYRHYLDARTPTPVRQGVDVVASAEAYALLGVGPGSVDARAAAGIQAGGFVESDGDVGLRFQVDASVSAGLDSPALSIPGLLDPPSTGAQFTQGTELLFGRDGQPKQVVIETVSGSAEHPTMQRLTVDVVTDQQRADVQAMRDFFVDPSSRNAARVAAIDGADWAPHAHRLDADLSVRGEDYGAGAGAGAIPGFIEGSADVELEHQTIDYDYGNPIR
jgi:hypothetical protein